VPRRAPGRRRFLAVLPATLRVQLLLLHGAHNAHGQPERGRVVPVRAQGVHAGRARGQRLVPQRLSQRVEAARLRAVRYVAAVRVAGQHVLQVNVVPRHAHRVQGSAETHAHGKQRDSHPRPANNNNNAYRDERKQKKKRCRHAPVEYRPVYALAGARITAPVPGTGPARPGRRPVVRVVHVVVVVLHGYVMISLQK